MYKKYQNIILDGRHFEKEELKMYATIFPNLPTWKKEVFEFILEWLNENPTIKAQTSGTTGKPKTILLQKNKMVNSALKTGAYFDLEKNAKALLCLSPKYIAGKMMIVRAFVLGLDLIWVEPTGKPLENTNFESLDFAAMVPLQVFHSFQEEHNLKQLRKIKKTIIGGGVVSKTLHELLQNLSAEEGEEKIEYFATYGMTETITHIAVKKLNGKEASENYETLANVSITKDSRGCLMIDAPDVAEGKVITNDLVKIISPTQFQWLGRFDNIINSGGVKIIPEEVERQLGKFLKQRFFVSSQRDELLGNRLILIIENAVFSKKEKEDLSTFMKNNLPKYSIPKSIFFIEKFMETESGKIQREKTKSLI